MLLDSAFRVIDINAEGLRLDRRSREDILGRTHWEAWPGTEDSALVQLYKRARTERVPVGLEHRYDWPDGRHAWLDMRAYPTSNGIALFYRDVTERRNADEAATAQAAERVAILGKLAEGVIVADVLGRITFVNEAAERLHGVKLLGVAPNDYSERYRLLTEDGQPYPARGFPSRGPCSTGPRWKTPGGVSGDRMVRRCWRSAPPA